MAFTGVHHKIISDDRDWSDLQTGQTALKDLEEGTDILWDENPQNFPGWCDTDS